MKFKTIFLTASLLTFVYSYGNSQTGHITGRTTEKEQNSTLLKGTLGTYATPPRLPDGRVDEKQLIAELKDIHANTYNWLIWRKKGGLSALENFLPLAADAGISVWITLVPPSERPAPVPYGYDYVKWAVTFAKLSKKYPNLVAWNIDDFNSVSNFKLFTPQYLNKALSSANLINPKLKFVATCYINEINSAFVKKYNSFFDGILFPYMAYTSAKGANLQDPTLVKSEIAKIRNLVGRRVPIIIDVYASRHSSLGSATPEYVKQVINAGLKYADGIMIYTNQDPDKSPKKYDIVKKTFANGFSNK
jgi:hypothetical protein